MTDRRFDDDWKSEVARWRYAMQSSRLSPETIDLRCYHLRRLAKTYSLQRPWDLTVDDLLVWTGGHAWKRETARAVRSSLRRFWAWGVLTGRTTNNIAESLPQVPAELPRPRPAAPLRVAAVLSESPARISMMLRLANELGMRRGEVARVHPEQDLMQDSVGWSLIVHGKGARTRVLPLPTDLALALQTAPTGYLFPNPQGGHLSAHWVGTLVSRALADGTTMHQLRHLCATELHDQTHDLRLVQTVLGHASLATTQRYIAVDDAKVRDAVAARSQRWSRG